MLSVQSSANYITSVRTITKTFRLLAPTNLFEEKIKFLKYKKYQPQFFYPKLDQEFLKRALDKISRLQNVPENKLEDYLFKRRIEETKLKLMLLLSIGKPVEITKISQKLYQCKFDPQTVQMALQDSSINAGFVSKESFTPLQTAQILKDYMEEKYNISYWKFFKKKEADFYIQVRYKKAMITISEDINWDYTSMDSVLAHEIDGHVIRALNALSQDNPLFQNPLPFYIKTEEGLASYLGDFLAIDCETARKHHAIKYLGGYLSLNNSFREVYSYFIDSGFGPDLAFQRAFRLKRGFTDSESPGCFAREAIYYEGLLEVKDYVDKGGDLNLLFAAKASLEDLKYIKMPQKLVLPKRIRFLITN